MVSHIRKSDIIHSNWMYLIWAYNTFLNGWYHLFVLIRCITLSYGWYHLFDIRIGIVTTCIFVYLFHFGCKSTNYHKTFCSLNRKTYAFSKCYREASYNKGEYVGNLYKAMLKCVITNFKSIELRNLFQKCQLEIISNSLNEYITYVMKVGSKWPGPKQRQAETSTKLKKITSGLKYKFIKDGV